MRPNLRVSSKSRDCAATSVIILGAVALLAGQYFVACAKHDEPVPNEANGIAQSPAFVAPSVLQATRSSLIEHAEQLDFTAAALAKRSAVDAALWLEEMPPSDARASAQAALAVNWAGSFPKQAVTWAQSLPEDEGRELALMRAFGRWLEIDTAAAMRWLADHESDPAADQMLVSLLRDTGFGLREPHIAFQWAELISASEQRGDQMEEIFRAWAFRNRDAATKYLVNSPNVNTSEKERLINSITKAVR